MTLETDWFPLLCLYLLAMSCGVTTAWIFHLIKAEVNAKVAETDRIGPLGFDFGVYQRVLQLHRAHYSSSPLRLTLHIFEIIGIITALIAFRIRGLL